MYKINVHIEMIFRIVLVYLSFKVAVTNAQTCYDYNRRIGNCVLLGKCPHLMEEFYEQARKSSDTVDFQTFVSQSMCGFDGFNFLICCTNRANSGNQLALANPLYTQPSSTLFHFTALGNQINSTSMVVIPTPTAPTITPRPTSFTIRPVPTRETTTRVIATTNTPTPQPSIIIINPVPVGEFVTPLPSPIGTAATNNGECGISSVATNRVVGGMEAKRGSYPWIVALGYYEQPEPNILKFFCGGSLVSTTYVITSAHCINPALSIARFGAHDISKTETTSIDVKIKRKVVHENFDLKTISNDIALIQLNNAVPFTEFIRPICLPEDSKFMQQDFVGSNPFVAGWGSIQYQGAYSSVLRDAQVPIIQTKTCMDNYSTVFRPAEMTNTLICAGNYRVDACQGDSGGPLMMPQLNGKIFQYYLIGIVSYGYECARAGFPGVYTRVAAHMQWIKENMS